MAADEINGPAVVAAAPDGVTVYWSPDLEAYAAGEIDLSQVRCVLCEHAPCVCPPFGTDEYFALLERRHGRKGGA